MELRRSLTELERLLAKHDYPWQAQYVRTLIELQDTDMQQFVRLLQDGGMWGGSGSVCDVAPLGADERAFRDAMIQTADEMERLGLGCRGSRFIAFVFRDWNAKGV
jgi:hypothetical protein